MEHGIGDSVREREAFWPGMPEGFDAIRIGRVIVLALRVEIDGLVVAGTLSRDPLMNEAKAARGTSDERARAVAHQLRDDASGKALRWLVQWWRSHKAECDRLGIPSPHDDDLRSEIKRTETDPLDRLPRLLEAWRAERCRQLRDEAVARDIVRAVKIDEYGQLFPAASRTRKIIAVLGPTNSGKTHLALERLSRAKSGFYAGPLRLLALEVYSRLNREFDTPCSLITGEERRILPGASHHACTVEMVDPTREVEVAVIDEAQLIADPQRGWAWTQAIACANAPEVYVLGSPQARRVIERFAAMLGVELEVRVLDRLSPLHVGERALGRNPRTALKAVERGDCLVVFTRRDCLLLRDELVGAGLEVVCIYGALAPEARQAQANRFTSGDADVIVATDAVGLGLNLRGLRRTVLVASQKYDGRGRRDVPLDLVRQICGRAGRYGHTEEDAGVAVGLTPAEHELVKLALGSPPSEVYLDRLPVAPSGEILKRLEHVTGEHRLSVLLTLFMEHCSGGAYKPQLPGDALERAYAVDGFDLPIEKRFLLTQVPVSTRDPVSNAQWTTWVEGVAAGDGHTCEVDFVSMDGAGLRLDEAERDVQLLNGYLWLAMKMPAIFIGEAQARLVLAERSETVTARLKLRTTLGSKSSVEHFGLPPWYWARRAEDLDY